MRDTEAMIYLTRHGETIWNREGRIQGHLDSPLTPRGIEQAKRTGQRLRDLIEDPVAYRIVTSPLGRCRRTAFITAQALGCNTDGFEEEPRLKEHGYGVWEGLTQAEIVARDGQRWRERAADRWNVRVPGGESYGLVAARVRTWLEETLESDRLIVISHATAGRILRGLYAGLSQAAILSLEGEHGHIYRLSDGGVSANLGLGGED